MPFWRIVPASAAVAVQGTELLGGSQPKEIHVEEGQAVGATGGAGALCPGWYVLAPQVPPPPEDDLDEYSIAYVEALELRVQELEAQSASHPTPV